MNFFLLRSRTLRSLLSIILITSQLLIPAQGWANLGSTTIGTPHTGTEYASVTHWEKLTLVEADLNQLVSQDASSNFRVRTQPNNMGDAWLTYYGFLIYIGRLILEQYLGAYLQELLNLGVLLQTITTYGGYAMIAGEIGQNINDMFIQVSLNGSWQNSIDWHAVQVHVFTEALMPYLNPNVPPSVLRDMTSEYIESLTGESVMPTVLIARVTAETAVDVQRAQAYKQGSSLIVDLKADAPIDLKFNIQYLDALRAMAFVTSNAYLWLLGIPAYLPPSYFAANRNYTHSMPWVDPNDQDISMPLELKLHFSAQNSVNGSLQLALVEPVKVPIRKGFRWRINDFPEFFALDFALRQWADHMRSFVGDMSYDAVYKILGFANHDTRTVSSIIRTVSQDIINDRRMLLNAIQTQHPAQRIGPPLQPLWNMLTGTPYGLRVENSSSAAGLGLVYNAQTFMPSIDLANYGNVLASAVTPPIDAVLDSQQRGQYHFETVAAQLAQHQRYGYAQAQQNNVLFPPELSTDYYMDQQGKISWRVTNVTVDAAPTFQNLPATTPESAPISATSVVSADVELSIDDVLISTSRQSFAVSAELKPYIKKMGPFHHNLQAAPATYGNAFGLVGRPQLTALAYSHSFIPNYIINTAMTSLLGPYIARTFNPVSALGEFRLRKLPAEDFISVDSEAKRNGVSWSEPGYLQYFRLLSDSPITLAARYLIPGETLQIDRRTVAGSIAERLTLEVDLQDRIENLPPRTDFPLDTSTNQRKVTQCEYTYRMRDSQGVLKILKGTYSKVSYRSLDNTVDVDMMWNNKVQMPELSEGKGTHSVTNDLLVYGLLKSDQFYNKPWIPQRCWVQAQEVDIHFVRDNSNSLRNFAGLGADYAIGAIAKNINHDEGICNPVVKYNISGEIFNMSPQYTGEHIYQTMASATDSYPNAGCEAVSVDIFAFGEGEPNTPQAKDGSTSVGVPTIINFPGIE